MKVNPIANAIPLHGIAPALGFGFERETNDALATQIGIMSDNVYSVY
jgi:hypothetical protein